MSFYVVKERFCLFLRSDILLLKSFNSYYKYPLYIFSMLIFIYWFYFINWEIVKVKEICGIIIDIKDIKRVTLSVFLNYSVTYFNYLNSFLID